MSLLIADVALGDGNGCDAALMMRNQKPDLRVLFTSFHVGSEVLRFYGLEVTDEHFLQKPFSPSALREAIQILTTPAQS